MLSDQDLKALLDRSERVNGFVTPFNYGELGTIASVVREDVPALVAEVRRLRALTAAPKTCICFPGLDARQCFRHRYGPHADAPCECVCHAEEREAARDEEDARG